MQIVMRVLSGAVSVYMLLLLLRIMLTWFRVTIGDRPSFLLSRLTDPSLGLFRGIGFLRTERVDFSPIAAFLVLGILVNILNTLAAYGTITVGIVLAIVLNALWSSVSWIVTFFLILEIIRLVILLADRGSVSPYVTTLDIILRPFLTWLSGLILRGKPISHRGILIYGIAALLLVSVLGRLLIRLLSNLLLTLPF